VEVMVATATDDATTVIPLKAFSFLPGQSKH
jgi:hypothetical protein